MTVAQLFMQLDQLLREQPQTADYPVELAPHGSAPRQGLATIHQHKVSVLLEARS